jgi:hypothetical protein
LFNKFQRDSAAASLTAGIMYNGCKMSQFQLTKQMSPDPVKIAVAARAQYAQYSVDLDVNGVPQFSGFQGTVGSKLNIASLSANPAATLPAVMYYNFAEKLKYGGGSLVDISRVGGWVLSMAQELVGIPGKVTGADTLIYPVPVGFGEQGQKIRLELQLVPDDLDWWLDVVNKTPKTIEELQLIYTAPTGYSTPSKTIKLQNGAWETGDYSVEEAVLMNQKLPAEFGTVVIS